jgi:hypothetical protein
MSMRSSVSVAFRVASLALAVAWLGSTITFAADTQVPAIAAAEQHVAPKPPTSRNVLHCHDGMKLFDRDGLWGMRDASGNEVIAPRYRALYCFRDGLAWAAVEEKRHWCAVGPDGALQEFPSCLWDFAGAGPHCRQEWFSSNRYDQSVLWRRAQLEFGAGTRDHPPRIICEGRGVHEYEEDAPL